ncbi:1a01fb81-4ad7-452b-8be1-71967b0f38c4 [Thermothielavioides terrestris]|uniref:HPt domain-containing protein n=2 Tax=Thermothielavioides terrestris TaxID=2587410 RepID=G2RFP4_THETT|nr:uncharacterized protein THITE_2124319 [Thermothielavioides terrestris NRRL 8126]AEO71648.1 hypothetical protein THITE_2124319 [Thermothielavioides terrestris NRRL 8126]SPQ27365.1 1a01fb81-4ad7-452b-8be1-71967b0f38c4 [Thermothielavioides terrestris]
MPGVDARDNQESDTMPDFGEHVDDAIFSQILEMDENETDREFSAPLVFGFFEQAKETFEDMQRAAEEHNLDKLSSLGHFLKGSSATLGFNKIRDSCQVIQQYGHKLNVDGTSEPDEAVCLKKIEEALKTVRVDTADLEKIMRKFFHQPE